jgi:hypothetical protein
MKCLDGTIDLDTATIKVMLIKTSGTYTLNASTQDENAVNTGLTAAEIVTSGYVGGFGGAGRKTVTVSMQANDSSSPNRVEIAFTPDPTTWTALGSPTTDTIGGVALIYVPAGATSDADLIPIAFWDLATEVTTNGGDISIDWATLAAGGNLQINCSLS